MAEKTNQKVKINPQVMLPAFLKQKIEEHKGKDIYLYNQPTHGCITHGVAVTFSLQPDAVFYEAPKEAVSW